MVIVHLVGRLAAKRLMRPGLVVKRQVALQPLLGRTDGVVRVQIHLLVFDTSPQPFHKHVVPQHPLPFMLI